MPSLNHRSAKPWRVFDCPNCGHRMRFGAKACGGCWAPTPVTNRRWFYGLLGIVVALGVMVVVIVTVLLP